MLGRQRHSWLGWPAAQAEQSCSRPRLETHRAPDWNLPATKPSQEPRSWCKRRGRPCGPSSRQGCPREGRLGAQP
eukprot:5915393-Alexandrium_andersonii.AAC.1